VVNGPEFVSLLNTSPEIIRFDVQADFRFPLSLSNFDDLFQCPCERPSPAKSGLVQVRILNDRTEVTVPDAQPHDESRLGPENAFYSVFME
jgi:hypothetical protein